MVPGYSHTSVTALDKRSSNVLKSVALVDSCRSKASQAVKKKIPVLLAKIRSCSIDLSLPEGEQRHGHAMNQGRAFGLPVEPLVYKM